MGRGGTQDDRNGPDALLIDLETLFIQRQDRLWRALKERYHYDTSVKHSQDFLLKRVSTKMPLVIMYADLVGSTQMSMTLQN